MHHFTWALAGWAHCCATPSGSIPTAASWPSTFGAQYRASGTVTRTVWSACPSTCGGRSPAPSADIALVHDLLVVIGIFALTRKEVDSSFVAVLLTVVGYSVNDTVVILDRIRENGNLRLRARFDRLVNRSMFGGLARSRSTGFAAT